MFDPGKATERFVDVLRNVPAEFEGEYKPRSIKG